MTVIPKPSEGGSFVLPPEGTFPAICYRVLDLGTQQTTFNGETKRQHKVLISWELKDDEAVDEEGRPLSAHQRYTWSMHEKATLRQHLESWRGARFTEDNFEGGANPFDVKKLLGQACLLSIVHNAKGEKTYANITSVSKPLKGMEVGSLLNQPTLIWLSEDGFRRDEFAALSDGLQDNIKKSPEYQELMRTLNGSHASEHVSDADAGNGSPTHPAFDDEIPDF